MTETKINWLQHGAPKPPSIGRCADLYHDVRTLRLAMEKEVANIQARESELREHIIQNLAKSRAANGDSGASGLKYRAQVVDKTIYKFKQPDAEAGGDSGWNDFTKWVAANNRFDMLQKRIGEKAVADYVAQTKKVPPGLEVMDVPDVSITKI